MSNPLVPATDYPQVVGQILRNARAAKERSQTDMAATLGLTQSAWSRIERGQAPINIEQLAVVAHDLGTTPSALLDQADTVVAAARKRGVHVADKREADPMAVGLAVIGVAALGALIATALSKQK